jgi:hypothetical protein
VKKRRKNRHAPGLDRVSDLVSSEAQKPAILSGLYENRRVSFQVTRDGRRRRRQCTGGKCPVESARYSEVDQGDNGELAVGEFVLDTPSRYKSYAETSRYRGFYPFGASDHSFVRELPRVHAGRAQSPFGDGSRS